MTWLDFEPCDIILKITRGQKVTNQNHSCVHNTAKTSDFYETSWDYGMMVSDKWIGFWGM